jgi:hypothetical protein
MEEVAAFLVGTPFPVLFLSFWNAVEKGNQVCHQY